MASEHPDITIDRVTDKYGGLIAVGRSYEYVTIGGQAIPVEEARKLPAMISQACDEAQQWQALQAERQAAHDAWLASKGDPAERLQPCSTMKRPRAEAASSVCGLATQLTRENTHVCCVSDFLQRVKAPPADVR